MMIVKCFEICIGPLNMLVCFLHQHTIPSFLNLIESSEELHIVTHHECPIWHFGLIVARMRYRAKGLHDELRPLLFATAEFDRR